MLNNFYKIRDASFATAEHINKMYANFHRELRISRFGYRRAQNSGWASAFHFVKFAVA